MKRSIIEILESRRHFAAISYDSGFLSVSADELGDNVLFTFSSSGVTVNDGSNHGPYFPVNGVYVLGSAEADELSFYNSGEDPVSPLNIRVEASDGADTIYSDVNSLSAYGGRDSDTFWITGGLALNIRGDGPWFADFDIDEAENFITLSGTVGGSIVGGVIANTIDASGQEIDQNIAAQLQKLFISGGGEYATAQSPASEITGGTVETEIDTGHLIFGSTIYCVLGENTVNGGSGPDTIYGCEMDEVIDGKGGGDFIDGHGGDIEGDYITRYGDEVYIGVYHNPDNNYIDV